MGKGTLTICSASAGSGKTYKLTGIYLASLFRSRNNYRRILAVTFTNKATAEMKSRILENLHRLAIGEQSDYLPELVRDSGKTEAAIRQEAKDILNSILHDYSRFSVSTIDSFFSKIIRAFAREAGLHSGFSFEIDHTAILSDAVDEMIASSADDIRLKKWLTTYALKNIDEEKSWNIKNSVIKLAEELFKEKYKILSTDEKSNLENKEFLIGYIERIRAISASFEKKLKEFGDKAAALYSQYGLTDDMFFQKGRGVPGYIRGLCDGSVKPPNNYVLEILNDPPKWTSGKPSPSLLSAITGGLDAIIREAVTFFNSNKLDYNTSGAIIEYLYALGILSDVLHNVHVITDSENSFLLSDAGEVLSLITRGDQSPFIYEKVGNRYENFMIDEFQDTSIIQWNNFKPLIENSMAEGHDNLVVGDVKQSIYRWRNSDWKILGMTLSGMADNDRFISDPLKTNYRSRSNIIRFNNSLFSSIPVLFDRELSDVKQPVSFRVLYSEAVQDDPGKKEGGYVRIEFIEDSKEMRWQDAVLEKLPGIIETFQDKGYGASDIGIIVRDGKEGASVLKTLIDYSNSCSPEKKETYNYNVVSNDSLLLSNSPAINFIISVLSVVSNPSDVINMAMMVRLILLAKGEGGAENAELSVDKIHEHSNVYFPSGVWAFLDTLKELPLFEATESIIKFFGLGAFSWNVAYLNTFQDIVLSFAGKKNPDAVSFLEWWAETGFKKSVVLPDNQEAIRILTIHKSKGLEFKVVLLPFIRWNLDHDAGKQPVMWVNPGRPPFDDLGIVPVKYGSGLKETIFSEEYNDEKFSVYLDNLNLLYVALTRAKDALWGFSVRNPKSKNSISRVLAETLSGSFDSQNENSLRLNDFYNTETGVFELGEIPENSNEPHFFQGLTATEYSVSTAIDSLRLKLHGENYFAAGKADLKKKINYGKMMHTVFESVRIPSDVPGAVRRLVLEGIITDAEAADIETRVNSLIAGPEVSEWFLPGNDVLTEAGILMPSGSTRRPDRIIFRDGKITIIDFKFGEENARYADQVSRYRGLMSGMGYENIDGFIWYVDKNLIVPA
jgi:ATP-dependent exoDNAse (exonuclease V) beta subunit